MKKPEQETKAVPPNESTHAGSSVHSAMKNYIYFKKYKMNIFQVEPQWWLLKCGRMIQKSKDIKQPQQ